MIELSIQWFLWGLVAFVLIFFLIMIIGLLYRHVKEKDYKAIIFYTIPLTSVYVLTIMTITGVVTWIQ